MTNEFPNRSEIVANLRENPHVHDEMGRAVSPAFSGRSPYDGHVGQRCDLGTIYNERVRRCIRLWGHHGNHRWNGHVWGDDVCTEQFCDDDDGIRLHTRITPNRIIDIIGLRNWQRERDRRERESDPIPEEYDDREVEER